MTTHTWNGRIDAEDSGHTTRWHQHVCPLARADRPGVALLGFACDEGVRRNGGRPGAAQGPGALRHALANVPVLGEPLVYDGGDVVCAGQGLEAAQDALAARVYEALRDGHRPLVLGGGHEVAWGSFQGLVRARPDLQRVLIVNLDAHFDLREAKQANSGTPFLQIQRWCAENERPFHYRVFGVSRFANTQALFDRARALGVHHWLDESLQSVKGLDEAQAALANDLKTCDAVYLTVCLDVLPAPLVPGVSAPAVLGVPLAHIEALIDQVMASGRVVLADIAELNPTLDRDGQSARVAARLVARITRRWQT
jgi:formiminoglutamase